MTRGRIHLTRHKGEPLEIEAMLVNDSWAYHETDSGGLWRVTHRPSGMRLTDCSNEIAAETLTKALPDPYDHADLVQRARVQALLEGLHLPFLR